MPQPGAEESRKRSILLVDDDAGAHKLRAAILRKSGYSVEIVSSIAEARAVWQPRKFGLVLVDLKADPRLGIDFCSELKQEHPEQLFAVLTSLSYPPRETCPDAIIPKIEGPEYFVETVKSLL